VLVPGNPSKQIGACSAVLHAAIVKDIFFSSSSDYRAGQSSRLSLLFLTHQPAIQRNRNTLSLNSIISEYTSQRSDTGWESDAVAPSATMPLHDISAPAHCFDLEAEPQESCHFYRASPRPAMQHIRLAYRRSGMAPGMAPETISFSPVFKD